MISPSPTPSNQLVLSLGSNIDARQNICLALDALQEEFGELLLSPVYESEAIGFQGDNFLNLVVAVNTVLSLTQVYKTLKRIEESQGRDRSLERFASRPIDIDILLFGDEKGDEIGVQLPRPEISRNAFVLRPLADLLPQQTHPDRGKPFLQLWHEYDQASQKLWPIEFVWP